MTRVWIILPGGTRFFITFPWYGIWLFHSLAEMFFDYTTLAFVAVRVRNLRTTTTGYCAEWPVGQDPQIFGCMIQVDFRHRVFVAKAKVAIVTSANQLEQKARLEGSSTRKGSYVVIQSRKDTLRYIILLLLFYLTSNLMCTFLVLKVNSKLWDIPNISMLQNLRIW